MEKQTFYIIKLQGGAAGDYTNGMYVKYVSKYYLKYAPDIVKAKLYKTLKSAIKHRDLVATHRYSPHPDSKIIELTIEAKELDA